MRLARLLLIALAAAALAFTASACGGGKSYSGTKPSTWAQSTCGALTTWRDSLLAGSRSLTADVRGVRDLKAVKARVLVFLRSAERSAARMIRQVRAAGAPAVKDGAAIQRDLVKGLIRTRASFTRGIASARRLPADDPKAFTRRIRLLAQQITRELRSTSAYFATLSDRYDSPQLGKAVSDEPACASLSSS